MSAGLFITAKYGADYGDGEAIHPIRVQPETLLASVGSEDNDEPAGAINNPILASASGSKRSNAFLARRVRLKYKSGTIPAGGYTANSRTQIPALNRPFYEACTKGAEVTYLGAVWSVTGRSAEFPE